MKIQVEVSVPDGATCFSCEYYDHFGQDEGNDMGDCLAFRIRIDDHGKCPACLAACEKARIAEDVRNIIGR